MKIVELTKQNLGIYKNFFITGLINHGEYFRISPADELKEGFPTTGARDSFTLGAFNEKEELVGVVSFEREGKKREKLRHKGLLFRMYVAEKFSGEGVGKMLLEEVVNRAKEIRDVEQINLTVTSTNERAKKLYEKAGFKSFSLEKKSLKNGDKYYDEEHMVLFLKK